MRSTDCPDSSKSAFRFSHISRAADDLLLPFALLTNDEDRERKAEHRAPGTYNVVATLESFSNLKEYRGDKDMGLNNRVTTLDDILADHQRAHSFGSRKSSADISSDPDILILDEFEDNPRRTPASGSVSAHSRTHRMTPSPVISSGAISQRTQSPSHSPQAIDIANLDGKDARLVSYYRNFVCRHFGQVQNDSLGSPQKTGRRSVQDVLETEAVRFPPVCVLFANITSPTKISYLILAALFHQHHKAIHTSSSFTNTCNLPALSCHDGIFRVKYGPFNGGPKP